MIKNKNVCLSLIIAIITIMSLSACSNRTEPKFTIAKNDILAESIGFSGADRTYYSQEYIDILDLTKEIKLYNISLVKYFYDPVTGDVAYSICISKKNGNIDEQEFLDFEKDYECGDFSVSFERNSFMNQHKIKNSNGNIYLYESQQVSQINPDCKLNTSLPDTLDTLQILWNDAEICLQLPKYYLQGNCATFDLSTLEKGTYCICSEQGLSIVWNLKNILNDFKRKLEKEQLKKGNDFNSEDYDYDVYDSIIFVYSTGIQKTVGKDLLIEDAIYDSREETEQGNTRIRFKDTLDISNIDAIIIDGHKCPKIIS